MEGVDELLARGLGNEYCVLYSNGEKRNISQLQD